MIDGRTAGLRAQDPALSGRPPCLAVVRGPGKPQDWICKLEKAHRVGRRQKRLKTASPVGRPGHRSHKDDRGVQGRPGGRKAGMGASCEWKGGTEANRVSLGTLAAHTDQERQLAQG